MPDDELLSTAKAAERLGLSRAGVLKLIRENRLKSEKVGRDHIIKASDLADAVMPGRGWPKGKPRKPKDPST